VWGLGIFITLSFLCLTIYLFALTVHIHSRLSQKRWHIPSIVYSDSEILYLGETIGRDDVIQMLLTRGYRYVSHLPDLPGRFTSSKRKIVVYLNSFTYPDTAFKGFLLTISFRDGRIETLRKGNKSLDLVALEPMEIARLFGKDREARELIAFHEVPRELINAVLVAEDKRFFQHQGIDWKSILRALWIDLRHGKILQGGSTITQQLAKNFFLHPERSLSRKLKEAFIALILETLYSKEEILEMYLNEIYMGHQEGVSINGVGEAARYYFGHGVQNISLSEAALLAGLIRAPNYYSPFMHPHRARKRRNFVLKQMAKAGLITQEAYDKSSKAPVTLPASPGDYKDNAYYVDFLKRQLLKLYPRRTLVANGLRIFTTLRPEIQMAATQAVKEGLKRLERKWPSLQRSDNPLQAAMIVIHPSTGKIIAMVGGRNYAKSPFNRAVNALRQPGSLFKPFVYLTALNTMTLTTVLQDRPSRFHINGKVWVPRNYDGKYHGRVTFRSALEFSLNAATVNLATRIGLKNIVTTARRLGFTSPLKPYPSLPLGSFEVTPLELARAYCVFANGGKLPFLLSLRNVVNEKGEIEQHREISTRSVCSQAKAYLITSILEGVVQRGTARHLKQLGITIPCAGKTGTTSNYHDSWFVGFTQNILAIVWVGYDDNSSTHLSGAEGAMTLWADFMKRIQKRLIKKPFHRPKGIEKHRVTIHVDWPPPSIQPREYKEFFLKGRVPIKRASPKRHHPHLNPSFFGNLWESVWKKIQNILR